MNEWVPEGYIDVGNLARERGVDRVRSDLFSGRLQAYKWDIWAGGDLSHPIEPRLWGANEAEQWLAKTWPPDRRNGWQLSFRVIVQVEDKPKPATDAGYTPPFVALMCEAVRHFNIGEESWPKKHELEQYFRAQKLPDGTAISSNHARYLATFCRPPAALSGGNKRGV